MKRLDVDEDFLTAVGGFDEAESAVVVPGFEGSGGLHGGLKKPKRLEPKCLSQLALRKALEPCGAAMNSASASAWAENFRSAG